MNSSVYATLITLCVDICKRNGKTKLIWLGDKDKTLAYTPKSGEMVLTVHRWFANKACPGDWLYNRLGDLAEKVTAQLGGTTSTTTTSNKTTSSTDTATTSYKVKITYKSGMNVRKGAGTTYGIVSGVSAEYNNVYTIVEEKTVGSQTWGRLKSGAGWICLTGFTVKV
jgi:N-acetylmuramoyl-L-alanine amidase CwlA